MKRYLLSIYQPDGDPPPPEVLGKVMRDVEAVRQDMQAAGVWVFAGGLHPPTTATVVRVRGGEVLVTDGPFAEGKEHVGGFTIVRAPDLDVALEWGRRLAQATTLPVEVRPFQGEDEPRWLASRPSPHSRSSGSSARSTAERWPSSSGPSATSTSPRRRSRKRSLRR